MSSGGGVTKKGAASKLLERGESTGHGHCFQWLLWHPVMFFFLCTFSEVSRWPVHGQAAGKDVGLLALM